jgi:hypothetical protein
LVALARFLHPAADSTSCFGRERSPLVLESRYKTLIQEPHPLLLLAAAVEWPKWWPGDQRGVPPQVLSDGGKNKRILGVLRAAQF